MTHVRSVFCLVLVAPASVAAQGGWSDALPTLLPQAEEIALARSAAPAYVSDEATVMVLRRGGYVVAAEGTNGVTCYVSRSVPGAREPHCFDEEGSRTILQIGVFRARMREEGKTGAEIEELVAQAIADGSLRVPQRPAMSYMMSSAQNLYAPDGRNVGKWNPHLMIYFPYLTTEGLGLGGPPSTEAAIVVNPGTPTSNMMIVVKDFVDPQPSGTN